MALNSGPSSCRVLSAGLQLTSTLIAGGGCACVVTVDVLDASKLLSKGDGGSCMSMLEPPASLPFVFSWDTLTLGGNRMSNSGTEGLVTVCGTSVKFKHI